MKKKNIVYLLVMAVVLIAMNMRHRSFQTSDMSGYEGFTDTDHVYIDMTVEDMVKAMDAESTIIVYFGFDHCPWCIEAVPVLNSVAKAYNTKIGYINTRLKSDWKSNTDIDDYDKVVEYLGDHLEYDSDGIKHLYTPHVFFIRKGEVVYDHQGTLEGHNATERKMTNEEKAQLAQIYEEGFEALFAEE